jgi:hypothetical protein
MDEKDRLIRAALDAYPLAPTPPGFSARVMAEIRKPAVAFRFDFLDLALPGFFALFSSVGFTLALLLIGSLSPLTLEKWKRTFQLLLVQVSAQPSLHLTLKTPQHLELWLAAAGFCAGCLLLILVGVTLGALQLVRQRSVPVGKR